MNSPPIDCILFNEKLKVFPIWTRIAAKTLFYSFLMWKLPRALLENPSTLYRFGKASRGHGGGGGGNEMVWEWLISSAYERQFIYQQITDFVLRIFHSDLLQRQHRVEYRIGWKKKLKIDSTMMVIKWHVRLSLWVWKKCQKVVNDDEWILKNLLTCRHCWWKIPSASSRFVFFSWDSQTNLSLSFQKMHCCLAEQYAMHFRTVLLHGISCAWSGIPYHITFHAALKMSTAWLKRTDEVDSARLAG